MKKLFLMVLLMAGLTFSQQNLNYETVTWTSGAISDTLDLGLDLNQITSDYYAGNEFRVIGLWFDGTWTNTLLTVYACTTIGGTYDPVKEADGTAVTVAMASNTWVVLDPKLFAGLRYVRLVGSTEGGARTLVLIKRQY